MKDRITLTTHPDFFAQALVGYRETVLRDEAKSNLAIAKRLNDISSRCQNLSCVTGRQRNETVHTPD